MASSMQTIAVRTRNWRNFETDDSLETARRDVSSWAEANTQFKDWLLESEAGRARLNANLQGLLLHSQANLQVTEKLKNSEMTPAEISQWIRNDRVSWNLEFTDIQGDAWLNSLSELFLYDLFIIMNVANPGSFDLYNGQIDFDKPNTIDLDLSSSIWENAQFEKWPKLQVLNVSDVADWYCTVRPISGQIPQNATERAIFSMMYMSRGNNTPDLVIWIFYALEGLLAAKVGENRRVVLERIGLLLEFDKTDQSKLKRLFQKLYDMRSALIHGGAKINHPMANENLNRDASDRSGTDYQQIELGFSVILACLQKMVIARKSNLIFKEILI